MTKINHHEDNEQQGLFQWASHYEILKWMFHIPNGGRRNKKEAVRLKRQGVKAGVYDIFLPLVNADGYPGLFIEMKRRKVDGPSRSSPDQKCFGRAMACQGYKCVVCFGVDEAILAIKDYIKL